MDEVPTEWMYKHRHLDSEWSSSSTHLFHTMIGVGECQEIIDIVRGYRMDGLCDYLINMTYKRMGDTY